MFQKLNITLPDIDYFKLKGDATSDRWPAFIEYSVLNSEQLFDILSKQVKFDVLPELNITEIKYPGATYHTDSFQTAINFYFDTSDDETFFWKEIKPSENLKKDVVFYDPLNLEKIGSFKANKGDCYILDVGNSIHSIRMHRPNTTRKLLRLYWRELPYNQVLDSIRFL